MDWVEVYFQNLGTRGPCGEHPYLKVLVQIFDTVAILAKANVPWVVAQEVLEKSFEFQDLNGDPLSC